MKIDGSLRVLKYSELFFDLIFGQLNVFLVNFLATYLNHVRKSGELS
jgi:hypothetical protein